MKLYTTPASPAAQKILVAAEFSKKSIQVITNAKSSELKGKIPVIRLPLLETSQGNVFESGAIARFLCHGNTTLLGDDAYSQALVSSWCDFCTNEIECAAQAFCYSIIGWTDNVPEVLKAGIADIMAALKILDTHLKTETYLVGRAISLADICIAVALVLPMKLALGEKERKTCPNVVRWFTTVVNQPEFLKVVGPVSFVKESVKPSGPVKSAAAEPPSTEVSVQEPSKPDTLSNLLMLGKLPESKFILDAWKRQYSNAPDHNYYLSMPWFWENCDFQGYSLWKSEYQHGDELKENPSFMTSNLVTGFLQRCDTVRKYVFGVVNILGTDGIADEISGLWLFRGSGDESLKAILEENGDAEYHKWTQITNFDEATKKEVAEIWCDDDVNHGKQIIDGKVFK